MEQRVERINTLVEKVFQQCDAGVFYQARGDRPYVPLEAG